MTGYIYSLHGKTELDMFYIGSTVNPLGRQKAHRTNFPYYLRDCYPTLSIIEEVEFTTRKELVEIEGYWIQQFTAWGFKLVNYNLFYGFDVRLLKIYSTLFNATINLKDVQPI